MTDIERDDRPPRYVEIDVATGAETVVYRASSLGACTRSLIAAARNYERRPHPEWFQAVLDEGTNAEAAILAMYEDKVSHPVINGQAAIELELGEIDGRRIIVRGHIDGINGMDELVEVKKFRDSTWPKFLTSGIEVNINYPWQVAVYMHGGGFEACDFVGGHLDTASGEIVEIAVKRIAMPPIPLKAIRKKVFTVEGKINAGFDPGDLECDVRMYPCPYWYLQGHSAPVPPGGPAATVIEADEAGRELLIDYVAAQEVAAEHARLGKGIDKTKDAAKRALQEWLAANGGGADQTMNVGDWTVEWKVSEVAAHERKASTRTTFNIKENT